MLEEVASCTITRTSYPFLLILAGIIVLAGFIIAANSLRDAGGAIIGGIVIGAILVAIYVGSRQQILLIASAGATITRSLQGMSYDAAKEFIDKVEIAKDKRYMIGKENINADHAGLRY